MLSLTPRRLFALSVLIAALSNIAHAQDRPSRLAEPIDENALRAHVKFLSDDLLEGRGPGTRGGDLAAKYIAAQFENLGLRPAGVGGTYFQPVKLFGSKVDSATVLTVSGASGNATFKFGDEAVISTNEQPASASTSSGESESLNVPVEGELLFVGYGIDAPELKWNDYKLPADAYRGKILVMLVNDPPATGAEPNLFGGKGLTYYGRWTYKYEEAARRGAAGAILLHTDQSAGYPWSVVKTSWGSWRYDIAREPGEQTPYLKLRSWLTDDAARRLMQLAGQDLSKMREQASARDFRPVPLNLKASVDIKGESKRLSAPNVVAMLPGTSAPDEYVAYTAHWDHLGVGLPDARGDRIYNGALDNATGVASILAIAEAFAKLPARERPARSILFISTTAEEQGLLGAEWFVKHPLVPLDKIAANINIDGVNFLGITRDFTPLGGDRSTLKAVLDTLARDNNLSVAPDPRPEQGSFYRSDHFPLAKAGIPAISLNDGDDFVGHPKGWGEEQFRVYNTQHYHQPSDEYSDAWNFDGMRQHTGLALELGRRIANIKEMPRYNPTDEFARARSSQSK